MIRSAALAIGLSAVLGAAAFAQNEGQDDLDKATQLKLDYKTLTDLGEVIRLSESALAKGLDKENVEFANKLLASALIERGKQITKTIFESLGEAKWRNWRKAALQDLERAVKLDAQQAEAWFRIAQLNLLPEGDAKRAREALDRSIESNKEEPLLKAQALMVRANQQKDAQKKLDDFDAAVKLAPSDASPLRGRGMASAQLGKHKEALADFDAALKLEPKHLESLEAKANLLARLGRHDEALATLEQARKLQPDAASPLVERARIRSLRDDFAGALADLDEAHRLDPSDLAVLLLRSSVHRELGDEAKALADVDRVLAMRPGLDLAMRFRAGLLAGQGDVDGAIRQIEEILQANADDADARIQLGQLYSLDGRHDKAIETFAALIKKDPGNWGALRARGDVYLSTGKHPEAVADYEKALALRPDDSGILNNFAWVLATSPNDKVRNGKRAIELAERACKATEHKQAHILSTLGAAYAETGDFETAMKWSQKAIELGRDDQRADLKKELESYKAKKPFRELKTGNEPEGKPKRKPRSPQKVEKPGRTV